MNNTDLKKAGITLKKNCVLHFESGLVVSGQLSQILKKARTNLLFTFKNCTVTYNNNILFHPDWGNFDMACAESIPSVFGGPADRAAYGESVDFVAKRVKPKKLSPKRKKLMKLYCDVARARKAKALSFETIEELFQSYQADFKSEWLLGLEIYELSVLKKAPTDLRNDIFGQLDALSLSESSRQQLNDGIELAKAGL